jgi:hypothetical protein
MNFKHIKLISRFLNRLFLIPALLLFFMFSLAFFCQAEEVNVTASIGDEIPPTAPILIAPDNGSYLNNQIPTFIFKKAYDAQSPVRHYVMYLNGELFIPEIPSSQTPVETDQYYCVISGETISVTLKNPLAEATYTWKIRAYDMYGNWIDSTTWTFTIDLLAPFLIITDIGENTNLNLSSQDLSSIPEGLLIQTHLLQPDFKGRSEPGAQIQISLKNPETMEIYTLSGTAGSNASFILKPDNNLKPGKYLVTALATDAAGNTVVLPEFILEVIGPTLPSAPPIFPPPIVKKPEAIIQLPQATPILAPVQRSLPFITLFLLITYLITAKIAFGFPLILLWPFIKYLLIPPFFRKKKICLTFNTKKNRGLAFTTVVITVFVPKANDTAGLPPAEATISPDAKKQEEQEKKTKKMLNILTDKKGRFNLRLSSGTFKLLAKHFGFYPTVDTVKNFIKAKLALAVPTTPDAKEYKKYQFVRVLSLMILSLAFISSVLGLLYAPSLFTLALFILCLDLLINILL